MREISRWDAFIDWLDFVVLKKFGLIRLKNHRALTEFYRDWLIDIAKKGGRMNKAERSSVLAWDKKDKDDSND